MHAVSLQTWAQNGDGAAEDPGRHQQRSGCWGRQSASSLGSLSGLWHHRPHHPAGASGGCGWHPRGCAGLAEVLSPWQDAKCDHQWGPVNHCGSQYWGSAGVGPGPPTLIGDVILLRSVIGRHPGVCHHGYADDHQLYTQFNLRDVDSYRHALQRLEMCVKEDCSWPRTTPPAWWWVCASVTMSLQHCKRCTGYRSTSESATSWCASFTRPCTPTTHQSAWAPWSASIHQAGHCALPVPLCAWLYLAPVWLVQTAASRCRLLLSAWYALPPHLHHCSTLRTFKTNLKTHLFQQHFS